MSENNLSTLQELAQLAQDAKDFYDAAAKAVANPELRDEFARLADAKLKLIAVLAGHIKARGELPERVGTLAGGMRQLYGEILAALTRKDREAYTYAAQLEEAEDRLLRRFEEALAEIESPMLREQLLPLLPRLKRSHEQMQRLKAALAA